MVTDDVLGFLLFTSLGIGTIYFSIGYGIGSPQEAGPGFFPFVLGCLLIGLAVLNMASSLRNNRAQADTAQQKEPFQFKHMKVLLIPASLIIFMLLLEPFGVFVATIAAVLSASFAGDKPDPLAALGLSLVVATLCVLVFGIALGLPIPLWPVGLM